MGGCRAGREKVETLFTRGSHEVFEKGRGRKRREELRGKEARLECPAFGKWRTGRSYAGGRILWTGSERQVYSVSRIIMEYSCLVYKIYTGVKLNNWISVFWEESELQFFRKWRCSNAHISSNDKSRCVDSTVPAFVLVAEVW